jgi:hypothetical protein
MRANGEARYASYVQHSERKSISTERTYDTDTTKSLEVTLRYGEKSVTNCEWATN